MEVSDRVDVVEVLPLLTLVVLASSSIDRNRKVDGMDVVSSPLLMLGDWVEGDSSARLVVSCESIIDTRQVYQKGIPKLTPKGRDEDDDKYQRVSHIFNCIYYFNCSASNPSAFRNTFKCLTSPLFPSPTIAMILSLNSSTMARFLSSSKFNANNAMNCQM